MSQNNVTVMSYVVIYSNWKHYIQLIKKETTQNVAQCVKLLTLYE